uniref:Uncharacterized protein n=1 Tax=Neogobius melanostomus TaxID=47308 RepID=A0A8C6SY46_9GOBI
MATSHDPATQAGHWAHVISEPRIQYLRIGASTGSVMRAMTNNRDGRPGRPHYGQRIIFTGPDGVGDYRPRLCDFPRYIGEGSVSAEATGDLSYLWRPAPHTPPAHMSRDSYAGGVGWGWHYNQLLNQDVLLSNMQIKEEDRNSLTNSSAEEASQRQWALTTDGPPSLRMQQLPFNFTFCVTF